MKKPRERSHQARSPEDLEKALGCAEKTIERLRRAESKRKKDQQTLVEITYELKERVKELNCLYDISSIAEQYRDDLDMIMRRIVDIIPPSWQFPEISCCRICMQGTVVNSSDFQETAWRQAQDILANGRKIGTLEVFYREKKPEKDEGPFLAEERNLLKAIAERIGRIVEEKQTGEALYNSEMKNIALLSAIPDLMFQVDRNGTCIGFHRGSFVELRELEKRIVGKDIYCLADEENILPRRIVDQVMSTVRRTLESGNPQVYEQHTSLKGTGRDYEVRMVVCRENEVLCIVRDMTRRKQLEREILEISNREQRRIGQDLHDSLCQHLAGIGFMGKVLERKVASDTPLNLTDVSEIVNLIDQAITLTKGYARGLNPVELPEGLVFALGKLAENVRRLFSVSCELVCDGPFPIHDNETANHLYRIVQESINNAIKHGKADRIVISLKRNGPSCLLTVSDNGIGIRKAKSTGRGMGFNIMRYRASMFGATVDMKPGEQGGTDIVCSFQVSL